MKTAFLEPHQRNRQLRLPSATARPNLSVVVPCHNESGNVAPLVEKLHAAMIPLAMSYEAIFVDDGSTDGTWDTLRRVCNDNPCLRALRFMRNEGQSAALWAGLQAARGEILITLDADLQNDPGDIPRFLEALERADCVCGSRVAARHEGDGWVKVFSSMVANMIRNKLTRETISDSGCGFRAFRRECIARTKFFNGAHRFLPTLIRMEGFTVVEIPIRHHRRLSGRTHYGMWGRLVRSLPDLLAVCWMQRRQIRYQVLETLG